MGWCESEMPTGQFQAQIAGQAPQQGHVNAIEYRIEQFSMAGTTDSVEHDPSQSQRGVVLLKSAHQGSE